MRLLVAGATGLIGARVVRLGFELGHEISVLARDPKRARSRLGIPVRSFAWDGADPLPPRAFDGIDAVLNFAGEPLAKGAWTPDKKRLILESRVNSTRALADAIRSLDPNARPAVFLSSSAIGIYGNRGGEDLDETSSAGDVQHDFLAHVCAEWERQLLEKPLRGVRPVVLRTGLVLAPVGGALEQMLPPFKLGAGGVLGSGSQWVSWIHIDDFVRAVFFILETEGIREAVNLTGPWPVTNSEFTRALAKAVRKPALLKVPAAVLKLAFGEKASMLLGGQRVLPRKLLSAGFTFGYPSADQALEDLCTSNRFEAVQWVPKPVGEVFSFFADEKNLERITPQWLSFRVLGKSTSEMGEGTVIRYKLRLHGLPVSWNSRIGSWKQNREFRDIQVKGPYHRWEHKHSFVSVFGGTLIKDEVRYTIPFGVLGELLGGPWVRRDVAAIFDYRRKIIEEIFGSKAGSGHAVNYAKPGTVTKR